MSERCVGSGAGAQLPQAQTEGVAKLASPRAAARYADTMRLVVRDGRPIAHVEASRDGVRGDDVGAACDADDEHELTPFSPEAAR